jgi:hypothetical protein
LSILFVSRAINAKPKRPKIGECIGIGSSLHPIASATYPGEQVRLLAISDIFSTSGDAPIPEHRKVVRDIGGLGRWRHLPLDPSLLGLLTDYWIRLDGGVQLERSSLGSAFESELSTGLSA